MALHTAFKQQVFVYPQCNTILLKLTSIGVIGLDENDDPDENATNECK